MSSELDRASLTILHFNDCYNVEASSEEPVGGAARFVHALHQFQDQDPIVLFSGDILSPSLLSTLTKGKQMLPVLDRCQVDCALYGNHDFDFGLDHLISIAKQTKFPWLMSNAFLKDTGRPLAEGKVTHIIEKNGLKIGLIGLIEDEWLNSLLIDANDIHYVDFVTEGQRLALRLKQEEKVDLVIALTHMRTCNDRRLAQNVPEIDLILGGHDHICLTEQINGKWLVKSGSDFRHFTVIELDFESTNRQLVDTRIETVAVSSRFDQDWQLAAELEKFKGAIEEQMEIPLAHLECDLDGEFCRVRSSETNLGNWITDAMLQVTTRGDDIDFAFYISGGLRSDAVHRKGTLFKMRDLFRILPYGDEMILVLSITGEVLHRALENGVSQLPKMDGRLPQVSGMSYAFDQSRAPGNRVPLDSIKIGGKPLELSQVYRMVTIDYIAAGNVGYEMLRQCPIYRDIDQCLPLVQAVLQYISALRTVQIASKHGIESQQQQQRNVVQSAQKVSKQIDPKLLTETDFLPLLSAKVEGRILALNSSE